MNPQLFKKVIESLSSGENLHDILKKHAVTPATFFKALKDPVNRDDFFDAQAIKTLLKLEDVYKEIDESKDYLAFNKATQKAALTKWFAEKLIPEKFGQRMEIKVEKSIDITAVLLEARGRVESLGLVAPSIAVESVARPANAVENASTLRSRIADLLGDDDDSNDA